MEFNFETGSLLLLIAAVVAMLTRRLRLPYSVGLVVAGIALAILPFAPKVALTKDLIFTVLLPPLLFEAALFIHWKELQRNFPVIVALLLAGRTDDHLVEITVTTVAAYGSFLLAEHFGCSGVLATITAGLVLGNFKSFGAISDRGKEAVQSFWEYAAFIANSLIFLLIGMQEAHQNFATIWIPAVTAIALVTLGRAVATYPCCLAFSGSSLRVTMKHQHVLFWGGLRGAVALALALGLPSAIPHREEIITISFAVVAFSVFVQGLTMVPFLRRMGEIPH